MLSAVGNAARCPPYELGLASLGRYLVERNVLVDPDVAGQAEHALGDDVAHDLVGAAFDPGAGRAQQHRLEFAGEFGVFGSAQHARRALQVERVCCDILDHRTGYQLADRILRPRPLALRQRRDRAHAGVFQPARLHRPVGQSGAHTAVVDRKAVFQHQIAAEFEQFGEAGGDPRADRHALVHQRGQRHVPAVIDGAEPLAIRNLHIGAIDFVEVGRAVGLLDRLDLDAGALHVQEEHGEALVFCDVGIRPRQQDTIVGIMRARGPDLLAVDDPVVAVLFGAGAHYSDYGILLTRTDPN